MPKAYPHTSADDTATQVFVHVELFDFNNTRHTKLDMPTVSRRTHGMVLTPDDIICAVNLQHDCLRGHCGLDKPKDLYQEREKIVRQRMTVSHSDKIHYILNIQSLHNYQALSQLVPHHLRGHSYHVPDEVQLRHQAAESIRQKQKDKTQAKEDLLVTEIFDRAEGSGTAHTSGTDLLQSLHSDDDLIDVIHGVLTRADTSANLEPGLADLDSEPLPSHQGAAPQPTAQTAPIFPTVKAKGKKKAAVVPSTL